MSEIIDMTRLKFDHSNHTIFNFSSVPMVKDFDIEVSDEYQEEKQGEENSG